VGDEVPKTGVQIVSGGVLMMCSGSPALGRAGASAVVAGTSAEKLLKGVDAGTVAITPLHPETIGTDKSQAQWAYIGRYLCRVEQRAPADLLNAAGTGTRQPKQPGREEGLVAPVIPFDENTVVASVDGVGDREHG